MKQYGDADAKTSASLSQYYRDEPALDNKNNFIDFHANYIILPKVKQQNNRRNKKRWHEDTEIMFPLEYLSNFWRTTEILLFNCTIILQLKWSKDSFLLAGTAASQVSEFKITNTKGYVPFVTLSNQDNVKLLKQLESGFKRTIS